MSLKWPNKDPNELLDYSLDWSRFLRTGEYLISSEWFLVDTTGATVTFGIGNTVDGLTNVSTTNSSSIASINLSGGIKNKQYKLICRIELNSNFIAERSVILPIKER